MKDKLYESSKIGGKAKTPGKEITFYRSNEKPYGMFSNLYKKEFIFEGRVFPTREHAYQYGKPVKKEVKEWLMNAPSPSLLAITAHGLLTWDISSNWSKTKVDRMRSVLKVFAGQNPDFVKLLLSTGTKRIVETPITNNSVNRFWGEVDGYGRNTLGLLLMELRDNLRENKL